MILISSGEVKTYKIFAYLGNPTHSFISVTLMTDLMAHDIVMEKYHRYFHLFLFIFAIYYISQNPILFLLKVKL